MRDTKIWRSCGEAEVIPLAIWPDLPAPLLLTSFSVSTWKFNNTHNKEILFLYTQALPASNDAVTFS
jgi:hypothetical protein